MTNSLSHPFLHLPRRPIVLRSHPRLYPFFFFSFPQSHAVTSAPLLASSLHPIYLYYILRSSCIIHNVRVMHVFIGPSFQLWRGNNRQCAAPRRFQYRGTHVCPWQAALAQILTSTYHHHRHPLARRIALYYVLAARAALHCISWRGYNGVDDFFFFFRGRENGDRVCRKFNLRWFYGLSGSLSLGPGIIGLRRKLFSFFYRLRFFVIASSTLWMGRCSSIYSNNAGWVKGVVSDDWMRNLIWGYIMKMYYPRKLRDLESQTL